MSIAKKRYRSALLDRGLVGLNITYRLAGRRGGGGLMLFMDFGWRVLCRGFVSFGST